MFPAAVVTVPVKTGVSSEYRIRSICSPVKRFKPAQRKKYDMMISRLAVTLYARTPEVRFTCIVIVPGLQASPNS